MLSVVKEMWLLEILSGVASAQPLPCRRLGKLEAQNTAASWPNRRGH